MAAAGGEADEAALLEATIAMSMPAAPDAPKGAAAVPADVTPAAPDADVTMDDADMDEEMQLALAMSMSQGGEPPAATPAPAPAPAPAAASGADMFQDPQFVQSVLGSLPGVDPTDPRIQSVLNSLPQSPPEKKDGEEG